MRRFFLPVLLVLAFLPSAARAQNDCEKLRKAARDAESDLRKARGDLKAAEDAARATQKEALLIIDDPELNAKHTAVEKAGAKYREAREELRKCVEKPASGSTSAPPCEFERREAEHARNAWNDQFFKHNKDDSGLKAAWKTETREYCECLRKNGLPLPQECGEAGVSPPSPPAKTVAPPPPAPKTPPVTPPPCFNEKSSVDFAQEKWNEKFHKTGQNDKELKAKWDRSMADYCDCLGKKGINPLPEGCREAWAATSPPPPTVPPPPSKSVVPVSPPPPSSVTPPPPPKTSPPPPSSNTPPPPPPPSPPPPPKSAPAPPPPGASAPPPPPSNYVCGKSPCDCAKQTPAKKCTTASGCICTKG